MCGLFYLVGIGNPGKFDIFKKMLIAYLKSLAGNMPCLLNQLPGKDTNIPGSGFILILC